MLNLAMSIVATRGGPLCYNNFSDHEPLAYVASRTYCSFASKLTIKYIWKYSVSDKQDIIPISRM